jgi:hypothetical protein
VSPGFRSEIPQNQARPASATHLPSEQVGRGEGSEHCSYPSDALDVLYAAQDYAALETQWPKDKDP